MEKLVHLKVEDEQLSLGSNIWTHSRFSCWHLRASLIHTVRVKHMPQNGSKSIAENKQKSSSPHFSWIRQLT